MMGNRSGSQWLTREKDVVAHLFFAASEINTVELEVAGQAILGSISFPSVEARCFSFFVSDSMDGAVEAPELGKVVRVRYSRGESVYTYLTAVAEVMDRNRWRLEFPRTIERNEQRIAARHRMGATGGAFRLRLDLDGTQHNLAIYDMSTGGLGFIFDPKVTPIIEGRALAANVCMPMVRRFRSSSKLPMFAPWAVDARSALRVVDSLDWRVRIMLSWPEHFGLGPSRKRLSGALLHLVGIPPAMAGPVAGVEWVPWVGRCRLTNPINSRALVAEGDGWIDPPMTAWAGYLGSVDDIGFQGGGRTQYDHTSGECGRRSRQNSNVGHGVSAWLGCSEDVGRRRFDPELGWRRRLRLLTVRYSSDLFTDDEQAAYDQLYLDDRARIIGVGGRALMGTEVCGEWTCGRFWMVSGSGRVGLHRAQVVEDSVIESAGGLKSRRRSFCPFIVKKIFSGFLLNVRWPVLGV